MATVVNIIYAHRVIEDLEFFSSQPGTLFECPVCESSNMICAFPRYCYLDEFPFGSRVSCNLCGRHDELVFHCKNKACIERLNGFDLCLACALKHFHMLDEHDAATTTSTRTLSAAAPLAPSVTTATGSTGSTGSTGATCVQDEEAFVSSQMRIMQDLVSILCKFNTPWAQYPATKLTKPKKSFPKNKLSDLYRTLSKKSPPHRSCLHSIPLDTSPVCSFDVLYKHLISCITAANPREDVLLDSITLYNDAHGLIASADDLQRALNNLNNLSNNSTQSSSLTLICNMRWHDASISSKIKSLRSKGFSDDKLSYFKLFLQDGDVDKAQQFYAQDNFCLDHFLSPFFGPMPQLRCYSTTCPLPHNLNISHFGQYSEKQDVRRGQLLCEYLLYLFENDLFPTRGGELLQLEALMDEVDVNVFYPQARRNTLSVLYAKHGELSLSKWLETTEADLIRAERHFERAISLCEENTWAHVWYGKLLFKMRKFAAGETHYARAVELQGDNPELRYELGLAFWRREKYAMAVGEFAHAMRLIPEEGAFCYMLGVSCYENFSFARALGVMGDLFARLEGFVKVADVANQLGLTQFQSNYAARVFGDCWVHQFGPVTVGLERVQSVKSVQSVESEASGENVIADTSVQSGEKSVQSLQSVGEICVGSVRKSALKTIEEVSVVFDSYRRDEKRTQDCNIFKLVSGFVRNQVRDVFGKVEFEIGGFVNIINTLLGAKEANVFYKELTITTDPDRYPVLPLNEFNFTLLQPALSDAARVRLDGVKKQFVSLKMCSSWMKKRSMNNNNSSNSNGEDAMELDEREILSSDCNKIEFGLIGIEKKRMEPPDEKESERLNDLDLGQLKTRPLWKRTNLTQLVQKSDLHNYCAQDGMHALVRHMSGASGQKEKPQETREKTENEQNQNEGEKCKLGMEAFYVHLEENDMNANKFCQAKNGGKDLKWSRVANVNLTSDVIGICMECETKRTETRKENKKDKGEAGEAEQDDDVAHMLHEEKKDAELEQEQDEEEMIVTCEETYYATFLKNGRKMAGVDRVNLQANYRYFAVFGTVPTKSMFKVIPF